MSYEDDEIDEDAEFDRMAEEQRQLALMIVDRLWNTKWIRLALQHYEYDGKGFDGIRLMLGKVPKDRPNMRSLKLRLEKTVLDDLNELQYELYLRKKENPEKCITADDMFKPTIRYTNTYGRNVMEVSLTRDEHKEFDKDGNFQDTYRQYLGSRGVDPKKVQSIDSA